MMPPLVDNLHVHRSPHSRLDVLPLGLAHAAEDAHQHLVRRVSRVVPATELCGPPTRQPVRLVELDENAAREILRAWPERIPQGARVMLAQIGQPAGAAVDGHPAG